MSMIIESMTIHLPISVASVAICLSPNVLEIVLIIVASKIVSDSIALAAVALLLIESAIIL